MCDLITKGGKTILQIDSSSKISYEDSNTIERWLKNRIYDSLSVSLHSKNELQVYGIERLYITISIADVVKIYSYHHSNSKEVIINPVDTFNIGTHTFYHYDMEEIVLELLKIKEKEKDRLESEKIKVEELKLNVLYVAGELSLIGFPSEYVSFKEGNTVIDIQIPVDRKSKVTKNYIRLNVRKTKKKIKEITDDTKLDISFVKETTNRKDKVVPFENISFMDSKIILKGFKEAYFKEDSNVN